MFIKHRNQTHTKTHTPNAKYLQIHSDDIPQHIHHLLSSHRKQVPNAYIHFHSSQTHTDSRPNVLYFILSQFGEPNITTTHPPKISIDFFPLCTQTKFGKKDLQTSGSHIKRSSHTSQYSPLHRTPVWRAWHQHKAHTKPLSLTLALPFCKRGKLAATQSSPHNTSRDLAARPSSRNFPDAQDKIPHKCIRHPAPTCRRSSTSSNSNWFYNWLCDPGSGWTAAARRGRKPPWTWPVSLSTILDRLSTWLQSSLEFLQIQPTKIRKFIEKLPDRLPGSLWLLSATWSYPQSLMTLVGSDPSAPWFSRRNP